MNFHIIRRKIEISSSSVWYRALAAVKLTVVTTSITSSRRKTNERKHTSELMFFVKNQKKKEKFYLIKGICRHSDLCLSIILYYNYRSTSECVSNVNRHVWISNLINLFLKAFLSFRFSLFWPFRFSIFFFLVPPIKRGKLIQAKNRFPVHSSFSAAVHCEYVLPFDWQDWVIAKIYCFQAFQAFFCHSFHLFHFNSPLSHTYTFNTCHRFRLLCVVTSHFRNVFISIWETLFCIITVCNCWCWFDSMRKYTNCCVFIEEFDWYSRDMQCIIHSKLPVNHIRLINVIIEVDEFLILTRFGGNISFWSACNWWAMRSVISDQWSMIFGPRDSDFWKRFGSVQWMRQLK